MADKKISQLSAATVPLIGTEEIPVVQGGSTKKVSIDNVVNGKEIAPSKVTVDDVVIDNNAITLPSNTDLTLYQQGTGITKISRYKGATLELASQASSILAGEVVGTLDFYGSDGSGGGAGIGAYVRSYQYTASPNNLSLAFGTGAPGGSGDYGLNDRVIIDGYGVGNVTIVKGHLKLGTSGYGIDFSVNPSGGTTTTSELLADYEWGTWTPQYTNATPPTTPYPMYTSDAGYATYVKVGNVVTVRAQIFTNGSFSTAGASGALQISGLPFVVSARGTSGLAIARCQNWSGDYPAGGYAGVAGGSASYITLQFRTASNGVMSDMDSADLNAGAGFNNILTFTCTYLTDTSA